jgi:hypothetical protein
MKLRLFLRLLNDVITTTQLIKIKIELNHNNDEGTEKM